MTQSVQVDPDDANALAAGMAALDMVSPLIVAGFNYWNAKRAGRQMPARADIDPVIEIPRLLPHIILIDVRREPLDFRFRLVGSYVRQNLSRDYVGLWFSGLVNYNPQSTIWPQHKKVALHGLPMLQRPTYIGPHRDFIAVENVLLPLTVPDKNAAMQIMFFDFVRRRLDEDPVAG
ncbi:PAS domain-containing protein [Dongia rigui]|uniref:PAS domain-containing protein n=1 Tax=Dongia rigui TaxID=940149 RepID=A0ABU5DVZ2_9PROT|nr:PAS domain-containing protein [Dongia rigui]MDY0871472.1 PAS domain-containing protein [Dongia rigui]